MTNLANFRVLFTALALLLCLRDSVALFFNQTSYIRIKPLNISHGFTLMFRTCSRGTLLEQSGTDNRSFQLNVVAGSMNHTSQIFTPSSLELRWTTSSKENRVSVGEELDQNKPYRVSFLPGVVNATLSVSIGNIMSSVQVPASILDIVGTSNMVLGHGFVGCIDFGSVFDIQNAVANASVLEGCPLDSKPSCEREKCPDGFKGYYCEENINDCASLPCHHASTCVDRINNYTCVCGAGWEGRNCDKLKEKKLCDNKPCANGGICKHISNFNNYTCTCPSPYTGRNCTEMMDPCKSSPCVNNGMCNNITSSDFQCNCPKGFGGKRCELNIDDCAKADCGSGKCVDGVQSHFCNCSGTGFTGNSCHDDVNECDMSPCLHNSTCTNYAGGYQCTCLAGYSGKNCELNINECASAPCLNGGSCIDQVNGFFCRCPPSFTGRFCDAELHLCYVNQTCTSCDDNPCQHGACNCTCDLFDMFYTCTCQEGFRGVNCSEDIDECVNASFCFNNSTCKNTPGGFYCECPDHYTGKYCNESRSICHPNPCAHGSCLNITETTYNCSCFEGWTGPNCTKDVDECAENTHQCNQTTGSCRNTNGSYVCACRAGYEGRFCEKDVDECTVYNNPCRKGRCENKPGSYQCFCPNGFTGTNCSIDIDECKQGGDAKCKNGVCVDGSAKFTCACDPGWTGSFCDMDIDECNLGYCKNNASCNNSLGNYTCTCEAGYTDLNCSTDIDDCASDPCRNNGTCEDQVNGYTCLCNRGYEGTSCETDIDWCNSTRYNGSAPCVDGVCSDGLLNYTCGCFPGFTGVKCEVDINECASTPCRNGATCVQKSNATGIFVHFGPNQAYPRNDSGGHLCICAPGFNGSNCENNINECQLYQPCNETGTRDCTDLVNDYNCTCRSGFKGKNCSEDIDECASNPCLNNGTCQNFIGKFLCNCDSNYTGEVCQTRLNPCLALSPCENGGNCTDIDNFNFTCSCAEGFAGKTCRDETTLGFDGTGSMRVTLSSVESINMSLSFQTIFSDGVLVSQSERWMLAFSSGYLEVLWGNIVLFQLGSKGSFTDSRWHSVTFSLNDNIISVEVDPRTCSTQPCSNKTHLKSRERRATTQSPEIQLVVGATSGASGRSNFVGSIRDLVVNNEDYYSGVAGVVVENLTPGFQRQNVCSDNPCLNGVCKDLWTRYSCECHRNWTSTNCTEVVQWGTFGAISQLNNRYVSKGNQSFAKYPVSLNFASVSLSLRTRSQSSVVVLLSFNASVFLAVETRNGSLQLRYNNNVGELVKNTRIKVDKASEHYISVNRSTVEIDGSFINVTLPSFSVKDVFVGGLSASLRSESLFSSLTPFRGCIRDVRLNGEQFLFFNQTARHLNSTQENIASGCSSEDVCGLLSPDRQPCLNNGNCTDVWNAYSCSCPWPYGGDNCGLFGCEWTNLCPAGETCMNIGGKAEYECLAEATFNDSISSASFKNSSSLSNISSVIIQFRTRQNASSLLASVHNDTFFEILIQGGRLAVAYNLGHNMTGAIDTNISVSDGRWHELRVNSTDSHTSFEIFVIEFHASDVRYLSNYSLVRDVSLLNTDFNNLITSSGVQLGSPSNNTGRHLIGCLREIRLGSHLLSLSKNDSRKTRPGFSRAVNPFSVRVLKNVTAGCHGNPVCTSSLCGVGTCMDLWNDFDCTCPETHGGRFCEDSPCSPDPCTNGNCTIVGVNKYNCSCDPGYTGLRCEKRCPCKNGGKCSPGEEVICTCTKGWTGKLCEEAVTQEEDDGDDDDNIPLIVGLAVAGGVVILIIIAIIFVCTRQTSSTFGTYSPSGEEKAGARVEMSPVLNVPPPEKLI